MLAVERCHLNVEAMAASPYVAGLSVLTDDEADLGAAIVEMGAGTTTIAIYSGRPLRACRRICGRRATHHDGFGPRTLGASLRMPSESRLYTAPC